jgi:hypothetical protein
VLKKHIVNTYPQKGMEGPLSRGGRGRYSLVETSNKQSVRGSRSRAVLGDFRAQEFRAN